MSLTVERASDYVEDFQQAARWYVRHASEEVAARYVAALHRTAEWLAINPALGRRRRFSHPGLRGLRSYRVMPPFNKHLIFYRHDGKVLYLERVMHGARNLPRRLLEPPDRKNV